MSPDSLVSVLKNPVAIWFVLAVFFIMLDFTTPTLVTMFFGMGALVAMVLVWVIPGAPVWLQGLVFLVSSIVAMVLLRKKMARIFTGKTSNSPGVIDDEFVGKNCTVKVTVGKLPGGRIEFRGVDWSAVSSTDLDIAVGTPCRIISREGAAVVVTPLETP